MTDEAAIHALYQDLMDGCNQGSGAAFAAVFTDDGDLVAFDGTHLRGREQVAAVQQRLFDKLLKGTRLVGAVQQVRSWARTRRWRMRSATPSCAASPDPPRSEPRSRRWSLGDRLWRVLRLSTDTTPTLSSS